MKNLGYISMLGVVGTIFSMVILSVLIITFNRVVYEEEDKNRLGLTECLLLVRRSPALTDRLPCSAQLTPWPRSRSCARPSSPR